MARRRLVVESAPSAHADGYVLSPHSRLSTARAEMARCTQGIEQMLIGQLPNLRDTQSGKELIAIGKQEGREQGLEQGLEQGRRQGELIGQIRVLQEVLGLEQSESETLAVESVESLTAQLRELRLQYRKG